jgi:hypothetical protein
MIALRVYKYFIERDTNVAENDRQLGCNTCNKHTMLYNEVEAGRLKYDRHIDE